jgi:hypothetical protein
MRARMPAPRRPLALAGVASLALVALAWCPALGTPLDFLPVNDPLEEELRALEVSGVGPLLPHLGMRPLQVVELPPFFDTFPASARISAARLARAMARERDTPDSVQGKTPRLLQLLYPEDQQFDLSVAFEGSGHISRDDEPRLGSGTGLRMRVGLQTGGWLAYSHLVAGYVEGGLGFAEAITTGVDAILHSEESYLAYTGERARWAVQAGRSRWHWGPGQEGSLLLSRTSAALTGAALRLRIEPLRADGMIFNATLAGTAGEKLAAHRLEWEPRPGLRIGLAEAARYHSRSWEPLYAIGLLPYPLVQNLLVQDEPDSGAVLRNNVMAALDVAWRPAPGTRLYVELLVDDLKTDASNTVSKLAYQLGLEGVGTVRGDVVTWGVEFTRLARHVYTSFYGRSFEAQDRPLGFPTGPDARRLRVRATFDPAPEWQFFGAVARTDLGESGLDVPYVPGSGSVDSWKLAGTVEETRELEIGLRYWPAAGVDIAVAGGYRWVENHGHDAAADRSEPRGSLIVRLVR